MSTAEHREEARMMGVRKKWEAVLRAVHPPCTHCPYRLRLAKFVQSPCFARRMDGYRMHDGLIYWQGAFSRIWRGSMFRDGADDGKNFHR